MTEPKSFRVLSLDQSGMRGTYITTYLDQVWAGFARHRGAGALDIGGTFVGTNTGGIIACALCSGGSTRQGRGTFQQAGAAIFQRSGLPSHQIATRWGHYSFPSLPQTTTLDRATAP